VSVAIEVRVPDIGDLTDVPVIEIHVAPGDEVAAEDPLVTLESDKATMDVPSPVDGTVQQVNVKIGDRVSEGSVLLTLEPAAAEAAAPGSAGASADERETGTGRPAAEAERGQEPAVTREPAPATSPPGEAATDAEPAPAGDYEADVVVIGSGPGGYTAAFRAADLGLRTVLVERQERLGGVCLNVGCIPSKALLHAARVIAETEEMAEHGLSFGAPSLDLPKLLEWKSSVVERLTGGLVSLAKARSVEVVHGEAQLTGPHTVRVGEREISFGSCIIAAGSEPARLPGLPDDERIIDSTAALSPPDIPERLLVIGGGIIGLEMATVYDALGSRVTVVEMLDQLIPGADRDIVRPLHKRISARYEAVHLSTRVEQIEAAGDGLHVTLAGGATGIYDRVLVAVGRRANGRGVGAEAAGVEVDERGVIATDRQMRTNVPWIYAIGDVAPGPMLAHKATHEAKVAAEAIAGEPGAAFDARTIPSVAYTDPEVAWMGLTETEARAQGTEIETALFPWSASGRALSLGRADGTTKLIVEPGSRRVLGAGIVGVNAGELIAELVHALEQGADAEDLALTIHPHPTLSETVGFAAEVALGTITDLPPKRRR
jgi:dihydrolipoamide dehydrogenase